MATWTAANWAWIKGIGMAEPAASAALEHYADRAEAAIEEKRALEAKMKALAETPRWKRPGIRSLPATHA